MIKITNENFEEIILNSKVPVTLSFKAAWCGPCRVLGPILEEVALEFGNDVIIAEVNVDEESELSQKHGIRSIPMTFIYKDGEIVEKFTGVKQKEAVIEIVNKYL